MAEPAVKCSATELPKDRFPRGETFVTEMNETTETQIAPTEVQNSESLVPTAPAAAPLSLAGVPAEAHGLLLRMFADPRVLAKEDKQHLVNQLADCVAQHPKCSDLRVLYGMALSVDLQAQLAMDELGEAVALDPSSFIAHLKMGELWMRLRVVTKAENHTRQASLLAQNMAQAEMARRQAATLRQMIREGADRSGYRLPWISIARIKQLWKRKSAESEALATADAN